MVRRTINDESFAGSINVNICILLAPSPHLFPQEPHILGEFLSPRKYVGESSVQMNWRRQPPALSSVPISHHCRHCLRLLRHGPVPPSPTSLDLQVLSPLVTRGTHCGKRGEECFSRRGPPAGLLAPSYRAAPSAHAQPPPPGAGGWTAAGPGTSGQDVSRTKTPSILGPLLPSLACHPTLCILLQSFSFGS